MFLFWPGLLGFINLDSTPLHHSTVTKQNIKMVLGCRCPAWPSLILSNKEVLLEIVTDWPYSTRYSPSQLDPSVLELHYNLN